MDLWELTKLLFRRWYFALPLLVASVGLVTMTAQSVSPDYKAKGDLQLIPPPSLGKPEDPNNPRPHNPWLDLGYQALGNAALLKTTDISVLEDLQKRGFSSSVTITLADRVPLLEVEAIGSTKEQATATVGEVIRLLSEDIQVEQSQYGVLKQDTITTLILGDGSNVEVVNSKVKRALVVTAGVGVLVTMAGTIGLDALIRRRRRRVGVVVAPASPDGSAAVESSAGMRAVSANAMAPMSPAPPLRPAPPSSATSPSKVAAADAGAENPDATIVIRAPGTRDESMLTVDFRHVDVPVDGDALAPGNANGHESGGGTAARPAEKQTEDPMTPPSDATLVLPWPHGSGWLWRDGEKKRR